MRNSNPEVRTSPQYWPFPASPGHRAANPVPLTFFSLLLVICLSFCPALRPCSTFRFRLRRHVRPQLGS